MNDESYSKNRYRWVLLALLWLLYIAFGLVNRSMFPLVTPIVNDLKLSFSQMGVILGSWQLTYIIAALVAGSLLDRWGTRKCILAGAMVIGMSAVMRFFVGGFSTMLLAVALFGAGGPMISVGGPKTISEWFGPESRGKAMGVYMTGPWLGGFLALALTNSLVMPMTGYNWRATCVVYGVVTFAIAGLWWFLSYRVTTAPAKEGSGILTVFVNLIKIKNVRLLLVMALFAFAVSHGFGSWLPKLLEMGGFSASKAGFVASLPLAASIPALLIVPRMVPIRMRSRVIAIFAFLTGATLAGVLFCSGYLLVTVLGIFGFINSAFLPLMLLILMDSSSVPPQYMGSAGGMFFCVAEVGGFTGPLIMGVLVDLTGSFVIGVGFLAALCLAILILTLSLKT